MVSGMTRSAALEARSQGVRVNCVSPGFLRTKLLEEPLEAQGAFSGQFWQGFEARQGRAATFDEVGDVVVMLSSPRMSLVIGVNLPIDGYVRSFIYFNPACIVRSCGEADY